MKSIRKRSTIVLGAFLLCGLMGCTRTSENVQSSADSEKTVQSTAESEEADERRWLDPESYRERLLENRTPLAVCREKYGEETGRVRNTEYKNLSFATTEFHEFPECEAVSLLRQEEIIVTPQESWDMIGQWLEEEGKKDLVDMEKEVRVVTPEVEWDKSQEYPYYYPALSEHMDLEDASGAFVSTKDCDFMVFYEQADGKMTEYLGKDTLAICEASGDYSEDVIVSGTLAELGEQSYPLISGELTIQEGADLLIDFFENGTVTTPAEGVTVGVENVKVFRLKDVYGYYYVVQRIYKGVPVSVVEKSGFQLVGCPYLPCDDGKDVYIVDDTGVSVFRGVSECSPLTELYTDDSILSVEDAAQRLSEKLAVGLHMEVEEVSLEYAPYTAETLDAETMLLPSWKFEGVNHTKGERLIAYVDVLTGDLYYYVIPEESQE